RCVQVCPATGNATPTPVPGSRKPPPWPAPPPQPACAPSAGRARSPLQARIWMAVSFAPNLVGPRKGNAFVSQLALEGAQQLRPAPHFAVRLLLRQTERRQQPRRFTDVPLHRMQPITTVGDMRDPEVFAGGQEVLDPLRQQRAERYLEWQRCHIQVVCPARARVEINAITANANRVFELPGPRFGFAIFRRAS